MATVSKTALGFLANDPRRLPASQVKQAGWTGVTTSGPPAGAAVTTNHDEPQAVILGYEDYEAMREALGVIRSQTEATLESLRQDFDERLASLEKAESADSLRAVMRGPVKLKGKLKAGTRF
jgi:PHD/YefM family antitoxin component YafN of YafNO toxin-antitoxin module